jgi:hypothetical protein
MDFQSYQSSFNFDETYAWTRFVDIVKRIKVKQHLVFYGFERKIVLTKVKRDRVSIVSEKLTSILGESAATAIRNQRFFEVTFMAAVLKDQNKHLHTFERSLTKNKDWKKQAYRCIDPDCTSYFQAQQILGKRAHCAICKHEIIIERSQLKNAKIVGLCCSKSKKGKLVQKAKSAITDIFEQMEQDKTPEGEIKIPDNVFEPDFPITGGFDLPDD